MAPLLVGTASALWLGVLTSICPCALVPNVAAVGLMARRVGRPWAVVLSGASYAAGRTAAYAALGVLIVGGLAAVPAVWSFLEVYLNKVLGPLLVIVGVLLLELLDLGFSTSVGAGRAQRVAEWGGLAGAALLGVLFALSFCPVTAALFFGNLVGLCVTYRSPLLLPLAYGVGTALPVVVFAVVIASSAGAVGRLFNVLRKVEWWARRATGAIFILLGVWYTLVYIFGLASLQPWG